MRSSLLPGGAVLSVCTLATSILLGQPAGAHTTYLPAIEGSTAMLEGNGVGVVTGFDDGLVLLAHGAPLIAVGDPVEGSVELGPADLARAEAPKRVTSSACDHTALYGSASPL